MHTFIGYAVIACSSVNENGSTVGGPARKSSSMKQACWNVGHVRWDMQRRKHFGKCLVSDDESLYRAGLILSLERALDSSEYFTL